MLCYCQSILINCRSQYHMSLLLWFHMLCVAKNLKEKDKGKKASCYFCVRIYLSNTLYKDTKIQFKFVHLRTDAIWNSFIQPYHSLVYLQVITLDLILFEIHVTNSPFIFRCINTFAISLSTFVL